jgi:cytochrome c oxidase cbb3-type subunit IV
MIQNVLRTLGGVEHYGILSLLIFCAVFVGVLLWTCVLKRSHLEQMSRIPLETDPESENHGRNSHE